MSIITCIEERYQVRIELVLHQVLAVGAYGDGQFTLRVYLHSFIRFIQWGNWTQVTTPFRYLRVGPVTVRIYYEQ